MTYEILPIPAFTDNYIWTIRDSSCAVVVDPGDAAPVIDYLSAHGLTLAGILVTHHHADHIGGIDALLERWSVPVFGPDDPRIPQATHRVREGDRVRVPHFGMELAVLEVPGHTRSHVAYAGDGLVFCGDTLFAAGCGRLFEGSAEQMFRSLSKLAALPGSTRVYCTHEYTLANISFAKAVEPANKALADFERVATTRREKNEPTVPTTIALELAINPFMRSDQPGVIAAASVRSGEPPKAPAEVLGIIREWKNSF